MLYYTILYYTILCYAMLCYAMLYNSVLENFSKSQTSSASTPKPFFGLIFQHFRPALRALAAHLAPSFARRCPLYIVMLWPCVLHASKTDRGIGTPPQALEATEPPQNTRWSHIATGDKFRQTYSTLACVSIA